MRPDPERGAKRASKVASVRLCRSAALSLTLLLPGSGRAQEPAAPSAAETPPVPASELRFRHELFRDARVTAYRVDLPPGSATRLHRHDRDLLLVFLDEGRVVGGIVGGMPLTEVLSPGDVRYHRAGFTHSNRNTDTRLLRTVVLEFAEPQGDELPEPEGQPVHSCNPGTAAACVDEEPLLCTRGFCVHDVQLAPSAVRTQPQSRGQLLVAVNDAALEVAPEGSGAAPEPLRLAAGEVAPVKGTRWRNAGEETAHLVLVIFR
ncbi:hypothetical protein FGE12_26640 [Aggregicoccus sp. 17bor-14]|uniref:hypothetical protein n=1 Tax=Myxococcaceae TaxID=31 RepID=UPI00129C6465|nr:MULTISPECIES: hypothetical protein [Myxococcaceae]MBF5046019.1 hypothetical protein [Simulacricoccus sp. 17bor-14]MRI91750.1 hypothetical protein [Aggregicoccus sp. 17bor-14]